MLLDVLGVQSFVWLSSILLCGCTAICLSTHQLEGICVQFLTILNETAVNIHVQTNKTLPF